MIRDLLLAAEMGLRDLLRERTGLLCQILAFAAVLTPLLVLYGLKSGVIDGLTRELMSDPRTRQISLIGDRLYEASWIDSLRADPRVGFVMPHTRALAANVEFARSDGGAGRIERGSLLASAAGDPLLPPGVAPPEGETAVLTEALAQALGIAVGDKVTAIVSRISGGATQHVFLDLAVVGLVDNARWQARGALVELPLLIAFERWRDGYAVSRFGWDGVAGGERPDRFANLRLYARRLEDVRPLVDRLQDEGYLVSSHLAQVEAVLGLDRSLSGIFAIIAGVALGGYVLAFGATLWANVVRKVPALSLLRLQGLGRRAAIAFPVTQALTVALAGGLTATLLSQATCAGISRLFGAGLPAGARACAVGGGDYAIAILVSLAGAAVAAVVAAMRTTEVDPAGGLNRG
ncbi:putative ABC transport system permease protein [Tistlia consotensis]|uniref:Putative ABC transport system permease protein n=1 Tax=Tistlia consotensis USBA 355 TaxID=560819 RepID=A0A1Y6CQP3_9PROT|nr:hypothetical protein [Tistlia consotensis]SMF66159.1 putative ABC transport system permease protein [Tistlia consotensis USBA 355]SNS02627.1 putative ABC transport system permease protein [Tistlia consotensis]